MAQNVWKRQRSPLYLVAIMLGMAGVLFARLLEESPALQSTVVLLSVALPLFAVGRFVAYLRMRQGERIVLVMGVLMLLTGAVVTVSGLADSLSQQDSIIPYVGDVSRWGGLGSLLVGLIVILYMVLHAGEAIEEIGDRFEHLAAHMNEGLILSGRDGSIALVNQRLLDLTGLKREQLLKGSSPELVAQLGLATLLDRLGETSEPQAVEYELDWSVDGQTRNLWVSASPILSRSGDVAGALCTFRDITDQARMARRLERYTQGLQQLVEDRTRKLRQSEERYRSLILHMNEGFLTLDPAFAIRLANRQAGELLDAPPASLVGKGFFDFVDPVDQGKMIDLFEQVRAAQVDQAREEVTLIGAGRQQIAVVAGVTAIRTGAADGALYSVVLTDVRALKAMQSQLETRAAELEAFNEQLKELDRAKDTFLSNVSHELRTPLSTIRGYVEMLQGENLGPVAPRQAHALTVMERNLRRLGTLIDEMIEFSRMEIRGVQLKWSILDYPRLVDDCLVSMEPQASARGITLAASTADGAGFGWGDPAKLTQALTILLSNAIKFSPEGGKVHVSVTLREGADIYITVRDEGIGIPKEHHRRVFDKFYQVDSSTSRRYEGTGIGLSIAKSIAEAHNGCIELESAPGEGSAFTLLLPDAAFDPNAPAGPEMPLQGVRVLLVAERADMRGALHAILRAQRCLVEATDNGYEALRRAAADLPEVILIDDAVAEPDPLRLLDLIRREPPLQAVAVVVMFHPDVARQLGELSIRVLNKPFNAADLVHCLDRAMEDQDDPFMPAQDTAPGATSGEAHLDVLAVDTDTDLLEWLELALRHRGKRCWCVTKLSEAVRALEEIRPGIILADADGVECQGQSLCSALQQYKRVRRIPVYAMTGLPVERLETAGASGALRKPFKIDEVMEFLDAVHAAPAQSGN